MPEHGKDSFRNEIFRKVAMAHRRGESFDYTTHEKLKEAIEKQLFEERRDTIKLTDLGAQSGHGATAQAQ